MKRLDEIDAILVHVCRNLSGKRVCSLAGSASLLRGERIENLSRMASAVANDVKVYIDIKNHIYLIVPNPGKHVFGFRNFLWGTLNHTGLEKQTRAFLDDLQEKGGPPIYTLLPEKARAVLSRTSG